MALAPGCEARDCANPLTEADWDECLDSALWDRVYCQACRQHITQTVRGLVKLRTRINEVIFERARQLLPIWHDFEIASDTMREVYSVDLEGPALEVTLVDHWRGGPDYCTVTIAPDLLDGPDWLTRVRTYYSGQREAKRRAATAAEL